MTELVNVKIPFSGFYHTCAETVLDYVIENELEYRSITSDDINIDYISMMNQYAEQYCNKFLQLFRDNSLNITLNNIKLVSPRFYNFENDSIYCDLSIENLKLILDYAILNCWAEVAELAKSKLTTRSGFLSFYDDKADANFWKIEDCGDFTVEWEIILEVVFNFLLADDESGVLFFETEDYEIEFLIKE